MQGNGDDVADCTDCALAIDFNAAVYAEGVAPFPPSPKCLDGFAQFI